jgi:hypothetical protein
MMVVVSVYRKRDRAPNAGWLTVLFGAPLVVVRASARRAAR